MPAERVLELLDLLVDRGIDVWVDGGWGVDALAGRQTLLARRPAADQQVLGGYNDLAGG